MLAYTGSPGFDMMAEDDEKTGSGKALSCYTL